MQVKNLGLIFTLCIILVISFSANIYSFNKLSNEDSEINKVNIKLLEEKEKEIEELKEKIAVLENMPESETHHDGTEISEENNNGSDFSQQDKITKNLINAANKFIDYAFNVNSENYMTAKQNASRYMTNELVETLFPSDGLDESQFKSVTKVKNIQVYLNSKNQKEVIVNYDIETDYKNGYVEKRNDYVLLHLIEEDGFYKVTQIEPVNNVGGV